MNSIRYIDDVDIVISYRIANKYIHADYRLYKDGEFIGVAKSDASFTGQMNHGSFEIGSFPNYIASEDKKESRHWLQMDNCPSLENITDEDGIICFEPYVFKTKNGYNFELYREFAKVKSIRSIPIHVCPKCGKERYRADDPFLKRGVNEYPSKTWDVLYQFSRCESCKKVKYRSGKRLLSTAFISSVGDFNSSGWIGYTGWLDRCKLYGGSKDPRSFLYEKKSKIPKETIRKKVVGHIKKVLKIRPLSNSERDFFRLIIGAKQLTQIA
jgi:hypothetical protein